MPVIRHEFSLQSLMDEIAAQRAGRTGPWAHLDDEPSPLENAAFVVDTIERNMERGLEACDPSVRHRVLELDPVTGEHRHFHEESALALDELSLQTVQEYFRDAEGLEHYTLGEPSTWGIEVIVDRRHSTVTVLSA